MNAALESTAKLEVNATPSLRSYRLALASNLRSSSITSRQFLVCFWGGGVPSCLNPDLFLIHHTPYTISNKVARRILYYRIPNPYKMFTSVNYALFTTTSVAMAKKKQKSNAKGLLVVDFGIRQGSDERKLEVRRQIAHSSQGDFACTLNMSESNFPWGEILKQQCTVHRADVHGKRQLAISQKQKSKTTQRNAILLASGILPPVRKVGYSVS